MRQNYSKWLMNKVTSNPPEELWSHFFIQTIKAFGLEIVMEEGTRVKLLLKLIERKKSLGLTGSTIKCTYSLLDLNTFEYAFINTTDIEGSYSWADQFFATGLPVTCFKSLPSYASLVKKPIHRVFYIALKDMDAINNFKNNNTNKDEQ